MSARSSTPVFLDTLRHIETPEGIELSLRVAGPVARILAWSMDSLIRYGALWVLLMVLAMLGEGGMGLWLIALFLTEWFYPALFEVYAGGATPGKKALGLKVIHTNGTPVDWPGALIRNLLRAVDFLPLLYGFGLAAILCNRNFQRLGDLAAGTMVIYRDPAAATPQLPPGRALPPPFPLNTAEQQLLIDFAERSTTLNPERQAELADLLARQTGLYGVAGVERLCAHARWLAGEPA
ncbi:MAG TPA: RDD family protein [Candidatus Competibacteraceae bacterium]|nr:RDD family protein [Candidatus Competibacteraceae bacterium]MCP5132276.1 RDD family protein [Gammaproteobacteria bacterium]HPF59887.1 RDD family protein [Candidatus Competibacteraceae bacterium]HRY18084.1 RDD family protein [Candidatus Competibacteraceae bacterium]